MTDDSPHLQTLPKYTNLPHCKVAKSMQTCPKYILAPLFRVMHYEWAARGGTDLERGYGDVRPWRPPFHASPAARKGPISSKRVSSQDPLLRKFWNFSLNSLNFHPNFSSQAPKFGNFQLTSPQIWKFSAHKSPFSEANVSSQAPHTTWKKVECPPPGEQLERRKCALAINISC